MRTICKVPTAGVVPTSGCIWGWWWWHKVNCSITGCHQQIFPHTSHKPSHAGRGYNRLNGHMLSIGTSQGIHHHPNRLPKDTPPLIIGTIAENGVTLIPSTTDWTLRSKITTKRCQSSHHTVNSSQPIIVWRVDPPVRQSSWRVDRSLSRQSALSCLGHMAWMAFKPLKTVTVITYNHA